MMAFAWTAATSFSIIPLRLTLALGLVVGAFSLEEGIRSILSHIFGWFTVTGWSSLMVVIAGIGSALLVSVGILGEYVGRLYEQVKDRPIYLVADTYNIALDLNDVPPDAPPDARTPASERAGVGALE
jgi:polyisoprenyl-phosphate glycosyltransferase